MSERLTLRRARRPNVVWVFGDQHRAHATSYRGDGNVFTPNIDNLAREGMRFDCAVAGAPWCTPFRGALLTGRYPHQSGVVANGCRLAPELPTVAHAFAAAGYHTAYVGKWHLDGTNDRDHYVPPDRRGGFHYWMGNDAANNQHECYAFGTDSETPVRLPGYETDAWSDLLVDHLRAHVGSAGGDGDDADYRPFFAVLSVQPPHGPNVPPTNPAYGAPRIHPATLRLRRNVPDVPWIQEKTRLGLAGYYAMVENLDYNIGRLRHALTTLGVDRDTYLIFFSDHGDMMGSHGQFGKSSPPGRSRSGSRSWCIAPAAPTTCAPASATHRSITSTSRRRRWASAASRCPRRWWATTTPPTASAPTRPSTAGRRGRSASRTVPTCSRSRPS